MVEFGEQLRRAREAKGMTQQSLAEQLYVTRQSVSRWECGDRYPDLLTTQKISQILEVSLDDLLSGKEMTKVVERNPVIENKVVNNIMIVLYAFVVLSYLIAGITVSIRLLAAAPVKYSSVDVQIMVIQAIVIVTSIAVFVYGLINAVRDTLSPKRMGAVLIAYYACGCIAGMSRLIVIGFWNILLLTSLNTILPSAVGVFVSYFFFVRSQNRRIWAFSIGLVSIWGICEAVWTLYFSAFTAINYSEFIGQLFSPEYISVSSVLSIAIDTLILYQTYTLYKKRLVAAEIAQMSLEAN
jgi:transcriptional regulator with XRE-family HTH domain